MQLSRIGHIFFTAILLFALISCEQKSVYEQNVAIPGHQWLYDSIQNFNVRIEDANSKYDISLLLRHNTNYKFSNIFVLLHQKGTGIQDTAIRYEMKLAELDGRWVGESAGALYNIESLAHQAFTFPDTGTYTFSIEQNMRVNPLIGITDVGLKVVKRDAP